MKVIKRDGRIVEYDKTKIQVAIEKANNEVPKRQKATDDEIKSIIEYIEELDKKRILVEDIQDIIEQKLMEIGRFELAKKYIVYRYTRALVRKSNTTDESILGLIRNKNRNIMGTNSNKNGVMASSQRNLIAGEVSKDLTKRILLPEKITKAWEEGILYFHNADYFVQPIFNSCLINIEDMLDKGTVINGVMIESPKSFEVACTLTARIIVTVASNQYGGQAVDTKYLGKYLRRSKEKFEKEIKEVLGENVNKEKLDSLVKRRINEELKAGVQTLQYEINTLISTSGEVPPVKLILHLGIDDEYLEENAMIIEEILKQRSKGVKNEKGEVVIPKLPKIVYVLDEKHEDLNKLAKECVETGLQIEYIDEKTLNEKYKSEGRFNQGIVSINLAQIATISGEDKQKFWEELDERLELCKEALMCRHYALLGTSADVSPILWKHGAIARLEDGEKIDKLLYKDYSSISLGYIGVDEMDKMNGLGEDVLKYLKNTIKKWRSETNIGFILYNTEAEEGKAYEYYNIK